MGRMRKHLQKFYDGQVVRHKTLHLNVKVLRSGSRSSKVAVPNNMRARVIMQVPNRLLGA